MTLINKKTLLHLADLARIELTEKEQERIQKDLGEILNYFKDLEQLDTKNVEPLSGGTDIKNSFRDDEALNMKLDGELCFDAFPEKKGRYNKVPPVFE